MAKKRLTNVLSTEPSCKPHRFVLPQTPGDQGTVTGQMPPECVHSFLGPHNGTYSRAGAEDMTVDIQEDRQGWGQTVTERLLSTREREAQCLRFRIGTTPLTDTHT